MRSILVVGASRGLGASLVKAYAAESGNKVFGTTRSSSPHNSTSNITYIHGIDVAKEEAGRNLVTHVHNLGFKFDVVIITAGYFGTESFDEPSWEKEITMYTTSSIAPVFLVHHLVKAGLINDGGKIILAAKSHEPHFPLPTLDQPGFMRTEMTKSVGFDQYWDAGGAVTPEESAESLTEFIEKFDIGMTGEYWAPRGPRDIGTAEPVLGKGLPTPLKLPW
ncbi:MAG: hypothetical protein Q9190_001829 [Brigantiaea leucoxantha]